MAQPVFQANEKLYYSVNFKGFEAVRIQLQIREKVKLKNKDCYLITAFATSSNTLLENFFNFKVRDMISSYYDIKNKRPLQTIKYINEGGYKRKYSIRYNYNQKSVHYWYHELKGNHANIKSLKDFQKKNNDPKPDADWVKKSGKLALPKRKFQDILSLIYYLRETKKINQPSFYIYDDFQLQKIKLNFIRYENLRFLNQPRPAILFETKFPITKLMKTNQTIKIWISNDIQRYPLKIKASLPFLGKVTINLTRIEN